MNLYLLTQDAVVGYGTYHNGEIFIHYTKKTLSGYKIDNSEYSSEK